MAGIQLVQQPTTSRVHRRPRHKFCIDTFPFAITPWLCAPVWPGETLVNAWFEVREVSSPIVSPLHGWGSEWYLFYCRLSDLVDYPEVMSMLIDPTNAELTGTGRGYDSDENFYHSGPKPDFLKMCYDRIVKVFFRDADEPLAHGAASGHNTYWKAKYRDQALFDSITPGTFDDSATVPAAASGMDDLARAADLYDYLVAAQLTDMSYQDWCAAYGVKIPAAEMNEPEQLLKFNEWVYPSNTIDPSDGSPSSAISLVVKKSFSEPKYFKEPGFIVGLHVLRPKLYSKDQIMAAHSYLNTALAWLPAMLAADPSTSIREFTALDLFNAPVVPTDKYIVDMRDIPMYGDQFTNLVTGGVANPTMVNFPIDAGMSYPETPDIQGLFVDPLKYNARSDGFINLDIVGRIVDYTTAGSPVL